MSEIFKAATTVGTASVVVVICYIIEAIFMSKIATRRRKNALLAWIPVANYFLIRDMARKKSNWIWLAVFLAAAVLGNSVVRWLGTQALLWSAMVWYWSAFYTLMEEETDYSGIWLFFAIFFLPVKLYILYRMAE